MKDVYGTSVKQALDLLHCQDYFSVCGQYAHMQYPAVLKQVDYFSLFSTSEFLNSSVFPDIMFVFLLHWHIHLCRFSGFSHCLQNEPIFSLA